MTNDAVLAKLEEDIRLRGFSAGTIKGYLIYTKDNLKEHAHPCYIAIVTDNSLWSFL